jgi:DNA-binding XRE family transcriptional regulator
MNDLRRIRRRSRLTQEELARLAGTDQATVSYLESGRTRPMWETAYRIARALKVRPEVVFPVEARG